MAVGVPVSALFTPPASATVPAASPPITAASLVPWMVKFTTLLVPSAEAIVKLSAFVSEAPRYCTSLLATV